MRAESERVMMCSGATQPAISTWKGTGIARWNGLKKKQPCLTTEHAHAAISEWHSNSILCVYLNVLLYFYVKHIQMD